MTKKISPQTTTYTPDRLDILPSGCEWTFHSALIFLKLITLKVQDAHFELPF